VPVDCRIVIQFLAWVENFVFSAESNSVLGPIQPHVQRVPAPVSLEVRRPGRESDYLPPSGVKAKIAWSYTSTSP
jgi:hypothetical protein